MSSSRDLENTIALSDLLKDVRRDFSTLQSDFRQFVNDTTTKLAEVSKDVEKGVDAHKKIVEGNGKESINTQLVLLQNAVNALNEAKRTKRERIWELVVVIITAAATSAFTFGIF